MFEKIGYLDEKVKAYQELDLAIRISKDYDIAYVNTPLFCYFIHDTVFKKKNVGLDGIRYLYKKHYKEILSNCGKKGLAVWCKRIAHNYGMRRIQYYYYGLLNKVYSI